MASLELLPHHKREPSSPVLLSALPTSAQLRAASQVASQEEFTRQSREIERERKLAAAAQQEERAEEVKKVREQHGTWTRLIVGSGKGKGKEKEGTKWDGEGKTAPFDRPPNAFELYSAIDRKDIMYIMRVRDHAFPLLLQKNAGEFPIVYAARIGKSHKDIAILIVGALSRYVNQLEEEDFQKKGTIGILRMLRTNLKLAIDTALLPTSDSSLLSSYLQVLIMSEGDNFIHKTIHDLTLLFRAADTTETKPVLKAERIIREFCTKELKSFTGFSDGQLGVQEYVANATMDLVIMSLWRMAAETIGAESLPTYTFARDQRTYLLFAEALEKNKQAIATKVPGRSKRQLETARAICEDTRLGVGERVQRLRKAFDGTPALAQ